MSKHPILDYGAYGDMSVGLPRTAERPMADRRENHIEQREREGRIASAIQTLEQAGLTVEKIDDQLSLVGGAFEWHRMTNHWKQRGSNLQGYGLLELIKAAKGTGRKDAAT